MADRGYGWATLVLDHPGPVSQVVVTTSTGVTLDPATVSQRYPGRYEAVVELPGSPRADGLWVASWQDSTGAEVASTPFTVGDDQGYGTLVEGILELCERMAPLWRGRFQSGGTLVLSDPKLALGGDATGWFLLRLAGDELGEFRRVRHYESGAMTVDLPFATAPAAGEQYALVQFRPDQARSALERAFRALAHTARVPVVAHDLAGDQAVSVPQGWEAVSEVWVETANGLVRVPPSRWEPVPGRTVRLRGLTVADLGGTGVTLEGYREARFPAFPDSPFDLDIGVLSAQASVELFLGRSGGPAVDTEERLRKAVLSLQEAEQARRSRRSRVPHNARLVVA